MEKNIETLDESKRLVRNTGQRRRKLEQMAALLEVDKKTFWP